MSLSFPEIFRKIEFCRLLFLVLFTGVAHSLHAQPKGWFEFPIPSQDTSATIIDLSDLNEDQAGQDGFISIEDGHFVDGKGQRINFIGTNLTFSNAFPDKNTAPVIAGRMAKLGYNIMRFHHMDNRSAPGGIWNQDQTEFDPDQLDKLDWLIYQLREKGIYTNINLHVSRNYPGITEDNHRFNYGKSIDNYYRPYIEMQKDFAKMLLTHQNPYTGHTYQEDPAIAFVEINNENSLISNWEYFDDLNEEHKQALLDRWNLWLNYYQDQSIQAFKEPLRFPAQQDPEAIWEVFWAFLIDIEQDYAREMVSFLKETLAVKVPVSVTQGSYSGVAGLYREANFADWVDMHAYWQHPSFPNARWSSEDWRIQNTSMAANAGESTLIRLAQHKIKDMPFTVSEYDHPAPNEFTAEMWPMFSSFAAFQDWDGIYHFNYGGNYDKDFFNNFFSSSGHPLKQIYMPVAAAMFRQQAVKKGENTATLQIPASELVPLMAAFGQSVRLHGSNMDKVFAESGADEMQPLVQPVSVEWSGNTLELNNKMPVDEKILSTAQGQLKWFVDEKEEAYFSINSEGAKAAIGYIGGESIDLGNVNITMNRSETNWGSICLVALDGKTFAESNKMLLVAAARVQNQNMQWNEERTTVGTNWGHGPTLAEGISATIRIEGLTDMNVEALDPTGATTRKVKVSEKGNTTTLKINPNHKTLWYVITK